MWIFNLLRGLLNIKKKIDSRILPSQGLFYKDDFEIFIKKADVCVIDEYELNYSKDDLGMIIEKVKRVVECNTILSNGYVFGDIKSIDVIFLFLEIVAYTKGEYIKLTYNNNLGEESIIEFSQSNFNYFKINESIMNFYDIESKEFIVFGYRYSIPSIGVENSLTNFLISKSGTNNAYVYNQYSYDFTYFLGNRSYISFDEIENLIQIFNFDISDDEYLYIDKIIKEFIPMQSYSLVNNGEVIEITSKINLEKIWK